jgi:very-short-patch-repair endonuclease
VKFESAFEKSLNEKLAELSYRVLPKYLIGELEVDFLVQGDAGQKAIISCEGDRSVPEAAVLAKMDRQQTLERLGWNIVRLRASEFLADEARAMRRLTRKLSAWQIEPAAAKEPQAAPKAPREDLRDKILKRADMIRSRMSASDKRGAPVQAA